MIEEPQVIPYIKRGQYLYIASGSPWEEALETFHSEQRLGRVWTVARDYRPGDMILTILNTTPRVFLCVEWARHHGSEGRAILVDDDRTILFENGISVNAVQEMIGRTLKANNVFSGSEANGIIAALNAELADPSPWFAPRSLGDVEDEEQTGS